MAKKLYLIRHGQAAVPKGLFIGSTDVEADEKKLGRVDRLVSMLPGEGRCYCSPLLRARQTVERLQQAGMSFNPVFENRFCEIDFGRWEMRTFQDIAGQDADLLDSWAAYDDFIFPGGEAVADFTARVSDIYTVMKEDENDNIIAVTHGGVIRTMICVALGLPVRNYLLFDVKAAGLSILDLHSMGAVLAGFNL